MRYRKILLFILLPLFFFSCVRKSYDFSLIPSGSVWKGQMNDGHTFYMIKDSNAIELSGNCFVENGRSVVDVFSFSTLPSGKIIFTTATSERKGKISFNLEENELILSLKSIPEHHINKQKIKLLYDYRIGDIPIFVNRYLEPVFDSILFFKDVKYGTAPGYYTSNKIDHISNDDYSAIFKEILNNFTNSVVKQGLVDQPLHMDIYYPYGDDSKSRPLLLYLHGGAFMFGDKECGLQEIFTEEFVKKGYMVISMNYRLGSTLAGFDAIERTIYRGVQDVRAALRYVTHYQDRLGIDPDQIYLCGSSAGGIIALTTTFMEENDVFKSAKGGLFTNNLGGLDNSGNQLKTDFKIAGVASLWGAITDLNMIKKKTPTLLFHGTNDDIVPNDYGLPFKNVMGDRIHNFVSSSWGLHGSKAIHQYMLQKNAPVQYIDFLGYGHEPHLEKGGELNDNIDTITQNLNHFLYNNIVKNISYNIVGKTTIEEDAQPPVYILSGVGDEAVTWDVSGGIMIDRSPQFVQVVWFNTTTEGIITAYIKNKTGLMVTKELHIINYE